MRRIWFDENGRFYHFICAECGLHGFLNTEQKEMSCPNCYALCKTTMEYKLKTKRVIL
jgi:hypothetical protein